MVNEEVFNVVTTDRLESIPDVANTYWVQAWKYGSWDHPLYGTENIDQNFADQLVANFKANVYGQELPFDYEHGEDKSKGLQAAAWIRDMQKREDGVYYLLEFTEDAANEIKAGKWRYVSPSYRRTWTNDATGQEFSNVPTGGGITNRPYFKGMLPLNFSEVAVSKDEIEEYSRGWAKDWKETYEKIVRQVELDRQHREGVVIVPVDEKELVLLRKFAEILGIELPTDEEFSEEKALSAATELNKVLEPMREAQKKAKETRTFREQFPAEYDRMVALEAKQLDTDAREFAESYERFTIKKDDKTEKDTRGFSALVIQKLEETHKKFSDGSVSTEDFKDILDTIASGGIVDYKEMGSSRQGESVPVDLKDRKDVDRAFSVLVAEVMTEDSMEYAQAVKIAAGRNPELFEAYMTRPKA